MTNRLKWHQHVAIALLSVACWLLDLRLATRLSEHLHLLRSRIYGQAQPVVGRHERTGRDRYARREH